MKGVILAGGTGTRLGALTRATNKHLLPLGREPMVCRAVWTLRDAGVDEIAVVTGSEHVFAFAGLLRPDRGGVARVQAQERPGGIAHALDAARGFAGGEPVAVLLADNVFERSLCPWVQAFTCQPGGARALLSPTEDAAVLAQVAVPVLSHDTGCILRVDEKPTLPASAYAVTGAYAFDEAVWGILPALRPSARGELEITDVLNCYAERGLLEHDVIDGFWCDAGQSIDAYYSAVQFVRCQEAG